MGMCLGLEASTHLVLGDVDGCCQVSSLARVGIGVIHLDPVDVVLGAQALCRGCTCVCVCGGGSQVGICWTSCQSPAAPTLRAHWAISEGYIASKAPLQRSKLYFTGQQARLQRCK